ncbi:hypothetical protein [Pectobacterium polaris]|uniref:hypothetical protein n=1 Tax=Pectobacterium polaris TaxID=2042057 RepID=UPI000F7409DA|nr:hypothetical protein [Pectobacterium polaris]MCU1789903.1 hypothetical protein [Pectobacterium polaris]MCU1795804.1 hypothetical protein [Pectobacterium polaris]UAY91753.1 hypothetical protein KSL88_20120 [Pectobacterium polaris]
MSHLTHLSHFPHIAARWLRFPARHSGGMFGGNSTLSDEVMSQGTIRSQSRYRERCRLRKSSHRTMIGVNPTAAGESR